MFKKTIILATATCLSISAADITIGGRVFTEAQIENFKLAYTYGKAIGGYENTMMGILNAESAGESEGSAVGDQVNGAFKRSYGIMQVKLGTYYWTKKKGYINSFFPDKKPTEEEILVELITNPSANVYTAAGFFKMMLDICGSYDKAISGYNRGHCKEDAKGKSYRAKVKRFVEFSQKSGFDKVIAALVENPNVPVSSLSNETFTKNYIEGYPYYSYDNPPSAVITNKKGSKQAVSQSDNSFFATPNNNSSYRADYKVNTIDLSKSNN